MEINYTIGSLFKKMFWKLYFLESEYIISKDFQIEVIIACILKMKL